MRKLSSKIQFVVMVLAVGCLVAAVGASTSFASGPALKVHMLAPDSISQGQVILLTMVVENASDATTNGPITVTDTAGPGLGAPEYISGKTTGHLPSACNTVGPTMTCVAEYPLPPGVQLYIEFAVAVEVGAEGALENSYSVSGGGAVHAIGGKQIMNVGAPGPFGFTLAAAELLKADGADATQAAADPSEFTTSLRWRTFAGKLLTVTTSDAVGHVKDVTAHLPPGLIGNPSATPSLCTSSELGQSADEKFEGRACPADSQVGMVRIYLTGLQSQAPYDVALYNMAAPYGVATELGFFAFNTVILLQAHVRPGDHGVDIVSNDTSTSTSISGVDITVWGDPADPSHDRYRALCLAVSGGGYAGPTGEICPTSAPRKAFLRMPTSCSGNPLAFGVESNSYEHPESYVSASYTGPTMTGCDLVPFTPEIAVTPTANAAASPTGVSVTLSLPQSQSSEGLQEADLKKAVVTLPEGMAINPSSADGLQACTDAQLHLDSNTPAECPDGAKIGAVLLHTQLITNPIEGNVYLRTQNSSDPMSGEMFRMAIELRDDSHGLDFKIPGQVQANPVTGRLTTTFDDNPQLPFEDIALKFKSGSRAPLSTPASCQTQTTEAQLSSWSRPGEAVDRSTSFPLTSGPEGSPCLLKQPFNPSFNAGVTSVQAGGFTPFLTTFTRKDADQSMQRVSVRLPLGLSGSLAGLQLCPEALAASGNCGASSEIGTVTAGAGTGPTPFYTTGGKVFMTGPYEGAPFGLSIVVPAKAGPFDLGDVNVRARVEVDPHTAQLTVRSDPLPQIVGGVPVNVRLVNVTINRPNFTFNPTNCDPLSVTGTMSGGQGAVADVSNHFQVTNCGELKFKPHFTASTSGKTSRVKGASLHVKLTYPKGGLGTQANIARVKVDLPRALPSRLTTLNHACPAAVFNRNPADCPSQSRVGVARAVTPILPVPLEGPAYFVSNGGEEFPNLIVVLQGYGVTVDLVGDTFIKNKTTSSTFKQVPDVPVGSFELTLPEGPFSALAANTNLCKAKLVMPTRFVAQNGAALQQSTRIQVTGCPRHKARHVRGRRKG
jgi:hypothetical protein